MSKLLLVSYLFLTLWLSSSFILQYKLAAFSSIVLRRSSFSSVICVTTSFGVCLTSSGFMLSFTQVSAHNSKEQKKLLTVFVLNVSVAACLPREIDRLAKISIFFGQLRYDVFWCLFNLSSFMLSFTQVSARTIFLFFPFLMVSIFLLNFFNLFCHCAPETILHATTLWTGI